jgi:hypothetical protein
MGTHGQYSEGIFINTAHKSKHIVMNIFILVAYWTFISVGRDTYRHIVKCLGKYLYEYCTSSVVRIELWREKDPSPLSPPQCPPRVAMRSYVTGVGDTTATLPAL